MVRLFDARTVLCKGTRSRSGGIGRRAAFRSQWAYAREGSSPFSGTILRPPDPFDSGVFFWQGENGKQREEERYQQASSSLSRARVAKLADARDLGSRALRRAGSSPASRTILKYSLRLVHGDKAFSPPPGHGSREGRKKAGRMG